MSVMSVLTRGHQFCGFLGCYHHGGTGRSRLAHDRGISKRKIALLITEAFCKIRFVCLSLCPHDLEDIGSDVSAGSISLDAAALRTIEDSPVS